MSQNKNFDDERFDLVEDTSPYVQYPPLKISPETEVYLRNTGYLELINEHEIALKLLREFYGAVINEGASDELFTRVEKFLKLK